MADLDLGAMTLEELKHLHKEVTEAITTYEERRRVEAIAALEVKAQEMGFKLSNLLGAAAKSKGSKGGSVPKYVHPENPTVTWTGRGRQPAWIKEALKSGRSLDEFLIVKD